MYSILQKKPLRVIAFALVLFFAVISTGVIFAFNASAETNDEGFVFEDENSSFDMERPIKPGGSMTFEAELTLPENSNISRLGFLLGNWESYALESKSLGIEFQANRVIRLFLCKGLKVNTSVQFNLPEENEPGTYRKIAFALDINGDVSFYVDGALIETKTTSYPAGNENFYDQVTPLRIGGDLRSGNGWYLHTLKVKSVGAYKGLPKADSADSSKVTTDGLTPMFLYDLTDTSVTGYLTDLSGNYNNAINSNTYEGKPCDGFSFTDASTYFDMEEPITPNGSMTIESVLTLPENSNMERLGFLLGNWESYDNATNSFGIEFQKDRVIRLFLCSGNKVNTSLQFNLPEESSPGTYRKISFVMNVNGDVSFYVDDVLIGTKNTTFVTNDNYYNQVTPLRIGGDLRNGNGWYLHDLKVKSIAAYKGVPVADNSDSAKISTSGLEAMFSYDLTDMSVEGYLADLSGNNNNAINPNTYDFSLEYDYSFAIIGDTQYMTRWDAAQINGVQNSTEHLKKVYDWILANKDRKNIQYVMGLGDITDSYNKNYSSVTGTGYGFDTAKEWEIAYEQISRLDGVVPYSVIRGNHDNETYFDSYFVNNYYKSQFKDPDYADNSICFYDQSSVLNAYTKFEVGTEKYLLLLLDDNPTDNMLAWAGEVVARNPEYRVIINTHTYLGYTGEHIDESETYKYAIGSIKEGENNGEQIWEKLVSKYENIILVLCGHDHKSTNILRRERYGDNGNAVVEMLICPQSLDKNADVDPKAGMVAMLYFSNGGKNVRVEYVSCAASVNKSDKTDVYHKPETNNTRFSIMSDPIECKYGYIPYDYSDEKDYPFVVFDEDGNFIIATNTFYGSNSSSSAVGQAKTYIAANVWNGASYNTPQRAAVILVRNNYSLADADEYYDNISQVQGLLTVDLNGYTITANPSDVFLRATMKAWSTTGDASVFPTEILFKDGNICISNSPLLKFYASVADKELTVRFENVRFDVSGSTSAFSASHAGGASGVSDLYPEIYFTDCVIDITKATNEELVLFNIGNTQTNAIIKVKGTDVIASNTDFKIYGKSDAASNGKVSFIEENGIYNTLTLPKSVNPSVYENLEFIDLSRTDTETTYRMSSCGASDVDFVPKMSITLDRHLILNVYVPAQDILSDFTLDGIHYADFNELKKINLGEEYYYLVNISLDAKTAARDVVLNVNVALGESNAMGTFTFGIVKYAEKILADGSSAEKTLVCDVLSYVRSAYAYFGTDDAETVTKINAILGENYDTNNAPKIEGNATANTSGFKSATFELDETPAMRFYLADGADASEYEFYIDGTRVNTEISSDGTCIDIDVYAYELCETVTYTIDGVESGSFHINAYYTYVSGDLYAGDDKTKLTELTARFWKYLQSARAYRNSVVEG